MKVSVKNTGTCRQTLKIEVPEDVVAAERAELLDYYAKGIALPGFRRGHAPKALLEKKFAKELAADLKGCIVPKFYHEAIEKEKIKVVAILDVKEPQWIEGQSLAFEVTVDVEPDFKLPKYERISIKVEKTDVSEKEVAEVVETILRHHATHEDITGRSAQEKDLVQVSYEATLAGQPLEEKIPQARGLGKGNGYWITCEEESFLPGMGRALIGSQIGDKKEVAVRFPEGFIVKELAGMEAEFKVEVTGLRETKLPEFNEELFKKLHIESEAELRKEIRKRLEDVAQYNERGRQQEVICKFLLDKTKLDASESAVKEQARYVMYDMARQRANRGMSQEQIKAQTGDMMKEAQVRAEMQVKLRYIMTAIARAENIQVEEQDILTELAYMAVQQGRDAAEYRKELEKEDQLEAIGEQIRFRKTVEFLLEKAKTETECRRPWWRFGKS